MLSWHNNIHVRTYIRICTHISDGWLQTAEILEKEKKKKKKSVPERKMEKILKGKKKKKMTLKLLELAVKK